MSERLKNLMVKTAASVVEAGDVDFQKVAEEHYMLGRIIGKGFADEVTGIQKEAEAEIEKEAGAKAKAFTESVSGLYAAGKKKVKSTALNLDSKIKGLGGSIAHKSSAATKGHVGAPSDVRGKFGDMVQKNQTDKMRRGFGYGAVGATAAAGAGGLYGLKKAID